MQLANLVSGTTPASKPVWPTFRWCWGSEWGQWQFAYWPCSPLAAWAPREGVCAGIGALILWRRELFLEGFCHVAGTIALSCPTSPLVSNSYITAPWKDYTHTNTHTHTTNWFFCLTWWMAQKDTLYRHTNTKHTHTHNDSLDFQCKANAW